MESTTLYTYQWNYDDEKIKIFGINNSGETIYVRVEDFTPYVYIELPENIDWTKHINSLAEKICFNLRFKPVKKSLL